MKQENINWQGLNLEKNLIDFTGATKARLEHDGGSFIQLTMTLKNGSVIRIRKADYGVKVEAEVLPTVDKYIVKHDSGIYLEFDEEDKAIKASEAIPGSEVETKAVPLKTDHTLLF